MKIAIHKRESSFSEHWINYCINCNIDYKIVNAFDNDIIEHIKDCDGFMWHHHQENFKDIIVAKSILFSLEQAGIKVFPNFSTGWHFDDKVSQKYLLEAINAPLVKSFVFYDKNQALDWAENTSYPKVFKLKGGASASNVKLVKNKKDAYKLIKKAFSKGFLQFDRISYLKECIYKFRNSKESFIIIMKGIYRLFVLPDFAKKLSREKGYIYFQDFIPNNNFDTRIVVIGGNIAAAEKRFVRDNDFRASGSGKFSYTDINLEMVRISFNVAKRLNLQSAAFDFILDSNGNPLIVEVSYGFGMKGIVNVPGYWDVNLNWHEGDFDPFSIMVNDLIKSLPTYPDIR